MDEDDSQTEKSRSNRLAEASQSLVFCLTITIKFIIWFEKYRRPTTRIMQPFLKIIQIRSFEKKEPGKQKKNISINSWLTILPRHCLLLQPVDSSVVNISFLNNYLIKWIAITWKHAQQPFSNLSIKTSRQLKL